MLPKKCPACGHVPLAYDEDNIFCTNCPIYTKPLNFLQKPLAWAVQRHFWAWRLFVVAWVVSVLIGNLRNSAFAISRFSNPFSGLDLGIHELGHVIFSPFGDFIHILGGSLFQCLFPLIWLYACVRKGWYFAGSLCFCWFGLNLFDVATYAADARARELPLTGVIGAIGLDQSETEALYDQGHDWYQLLSRTHHLNSDLAIAHGLRIAGTIMFLIGLSLAAVLLIQMFSGTVQRLIARKAVSVDYVNRPD